MNIINILLILAVLMFGLVGNMIYENDQLLEEPKGIEQVTSVLNWDLEYNLTEPTGKNDIIPARVHNIVYKFVDFFGYSVMEAGKTGIEFGYAHPEYDYNLGVKLIKYIFILMIISLLVPLFIPVVALITIIGMGIISLFKWLKNEKTTKNN